MTTDPVAATDAKTARAQEVAEKYGIEMDQIYLDNDKREQGTPRRIRVLSTVSKEDKACCVNCDIHGKPAGKTLWISFKRLSTKRLYTRIQ